MVVSTPIKLKVGTSVIMDYHRNGVDPPEVKDHPFFVLREATKEEWMKEIIEDEIPTNGIIPFPYFYEVSTD